MIGTATTRLASPLTLPCGARLANRISKAAMTEGLADTRNHATLRHSILYARWAKSGAGMLLTGNVQVDRRYLERPGNVAIDGPQDAESLNLLRAWAKAGTANGTHLWMQLSHAGRQTPAYVAKTPVAPSEKQLKMPGASFGKPRALREDELPDIVARFAYAARIAKETGFTGVQVHAAHGYLLSEFLSPDVNDRTDRYGGSLENRARLLLEIIAAVRAEVGTEFPISVKLNSADFQRGGFSQDDSIAVARLLEAAKIDLLEISGGTYEQPRLLGLDLTPNPDRSEKPRASTVAREVYFLAYAKDIRAAVKLPLMVTGGFRSRGAMDDALADDALDVVGIARPFCVDPEISKGLLAATLGETPTFERTLKLGSGLFGPNSPILYIKAANGWGTQGWFCLQLLRMGDGLEPDLRMSVFSALQRYLKHETDGAKALVRS